MTGVVIPVEIESKDTEKYLETINKNLQKLGVSAGTVSGKFSSMFSNLKLSEATNVNKQIAGINNVKTAYQDTFNTASTAASSTNDTITKLISTTKTLAASVATAAFAAGLVKVADDYAAIANKIKLVSDESADLEAIQKSLGRAATDARGTLKSGVDIYFSFGRALRETGIEASTLIGLVSNVQKTIATSNTSVDSANAALMQLGQGLASGTLRGEEFNSVSEQIPALAAAIAKGIGVSTGELRKLAAEGALTPGVIVGGLTKATAFINSEFSKAGATISQGMTQASEAVTEFLNEILKLGNVSQRAYRVLSGFANGLKSFTESLQEHVASMSITMSDYLGEVDALAASQEKFAGFKDIARIYEVTYLFDNMATSVKYLKDLFESIKMPEIFTGTNVLAELDAGLIKIAGLLVSIGNLLVSSVKNFTSILPTISGPILDSFTESTVAAKYGIASINLAISNGLRPLITFINKMTDLRSMGLLPDTLMERSVAGILKASSIQELTDKIYMLIDAVETTAGTSFTATMLLWYEGLVSLANPIKNLGVYLGILDNRLISINGISFDKVFNALATFKNVVIRVFNDVILVKYGEQILSLFEKIELAVTPFIDVFKEKFFEGNAASTGASLGSWLIGIFKRAIFMLNQNLDISIDFSGIIKGAFDLKILIDKLLSSFGSFAIGFIDALQIDKILINLFNKIAELANEYLGESLGEYIATATSEAFRSTLKMGEDASAFLKNFDFSGIAISGVQAITAVVAGLLNTLTAVIRYRLENSFTKDFAVTILDNLISTLENIDFYKVGYIIGSAVNKIIMAIYKVIKTLKSIDWGAILSPDNNELTSLLLRLLKVILSGVKNLLVGIKEGIVRINLVEILFDLGAVPVAFGRLQDVIVSSYISMMTSIIKFISKVAIDPLGMIFESKKTFKFNIEGVQAGIKAGVDSLKSINMDSVYDFFKESARAIIEMIVKIINSAMKLYDRIVPVFKRFTNDIAQLFWVLYDKVVGHSYWPDMISGIINDTSRLGAAKDKILEFSNYVTSAFSSLLSGVSIDMSSPLVKAFSNIKQSIKTLSYEAYVSIGAFLVELGIMIFRFEKGLYLFALHQLAVLVLGSIDEINHNVTAAVSNGLIDIAGKVVADTLYLVKQSFMAFGSFLPKLVNEVLLQFGTIGEALAKVYSALPSVLQHVLVFALIAQMGLLGKTVKASFTSLITAPLLAAGAALGGMLSTIFGSFSTASTKQSMKTGAVWSALFGALNPRGMLAAVAVTMLGVLSNVDAMSAIIGGGYPLLLLAIWGRNSKGLQRLLLDTTRGTLKVLADGLDIVLRPRASKQTPLSSVFESLTRQLRIFRVQWKRYSAGRISLDQLTNGLSTSIESEFIKIFRGLKTSVMHQFIVLKLAFERNWTDFSDFMRARIAIFKVRWQATNWFHGADSVFGRLFSAIKGMLLRHLDTLKTWLSAAWSGVLSVVTSLGFARTLITIIVALAAAYSGFTNAAEIGGNSIGELTDSFLMLALAIPLSIIPLKLVGSMFRVLVNSFKLGSISEALKLESARLNKSFTDFYNGLKSVLGKIESLGEAGFKDILKKVRPPKPTKTPGTALIVYDPSVLNNVRKSFSEQLKELYESLKKTATDIASKLGGLLKKLFSVKALIATAVVVGGALSLEAFFFGDTNDFITNVGRAAQSWLNFVGLLDKPPKVAALVVIEQKLDSIKKIGGGTFDFTPELNNIDFSRLSYKEQRLLVKESNKNVAEINKLQEIWKKDGGLTEDQLGSLEKLLEKQRELLNKLPQLDANNLKLEDVSVRLSKAASQSSVDVSKTISNMLRSIVDTTKQAGGEIANIYDATSSLVSEYSTLLYNSGAKLFGLDSIKPSEAIAPAIEVAPIKVPNAFEGLGASMSNNFKEEIKKVGLPPVKELGLFEKATKAMNFPWRVISEQFKKNLTEAFTPDEVNSNLLKATSEAVNKALSVEAIMPPGSFKVGTENANLLVEMLARYRANVKSTVPEQEALKEAIDAQARKVMDLAEAYSRAAEAQKDLTEQNHDKIVEDEWLRKIVGGLDSWVQSPTSTMVGRGVTSLVNNVGWKDFAADYSKGLKEAFSDVGTDALYRLQDALKDTDEVLKKTPLGSAKGVTLRFRYIGLKDAIKEVAELDKEIVNIGGVSNNISKVFATLDGTKIELIRRGDYTLYKNIADITQKILNKRIEIEKTPVLDKEQQDLLTLQLEKLEKERDVLIKVSIDPRTAEEAFKALTDKLKNVLPESDFKISEEFLKVNPIVGIIITSVDKLKTSVSDLKLKGKFEEAELAANRLKDATLNLKSVLDDFKFDSVHKVAENLGLVPEKLAAAGPAAMAEAKRIAEGLNRAQSEFVKPNLSELQLDANARYLVEMKKQKESFISLDIFKEAGKEDAKSYTDAFAKTLKDAGLKGLEVAEYANFSKSQQAEFRAIISESTKVNKLLEAAPANAIPTSEVSKATITIGAYQKQLDSLVETSKLGQRTMNDMVSSFKDIFDGFSISDWFRIDPKVMKGLIEFENKMAALKVTMGQKPMSQMTDEEINNFMKSLEEADKKRRENAQQFASYPTKQSQSGLDEAAYARINGDYRDKIHELKSSSENLAAEMKGKGEEEARQMQLQILENNRKLDEVFVDAFSSMPFESTKMALKQAGVGYGEELAKATDQQLDVMKGIGLKIKAAAFIAANSDDENTRIAAQMLVERLKGNLDSLVKEAQANLMLEAGRNFATSSIEGFSSGLTEVLSGKKSLKDFVTEQVDKFTSGVIDAFVKGLMSPLSGENGIISTWLKEQGENLFRLGASIFSKDGVSIENLSKKSPDTILLGKIDITLNEILLAISSGNLGNNALSAATTLKMNNNSGIFGDFKTGLDDVFKGVTDDIDTFGKDIMDSFDNIDFDGIGSSVGSLFKMGISFFGSFFKDGGIAGYARGGPVHGPGSGRSDSILARISRGEYIVNAARTAMYLPLLNAINYGNGLPAFANGGMYGQAALSDSVNQRDSSMALSGKLEQIFYLNITGDVSRQTRREIQQMIPEIAHGVNIRNREENIR